MTNRKNIEKRVIQTAETLLYKQQYVSPIDIFLGLGWLQPIHIQEWRKGKVPYLEDVVQVNLSKINFGMKCFGKWAREKKLKPSETAYFVRSKGPKRKAIFCKTCNPLIEKIYATHYIFPTLSKKKQQRLKEKLDKPPDLVAHVVIHDTQCSHCKKELFKGELLFMEDKPSCLSCAGFGDLVFLESGDQKLTCRARKYSDKNIIVVKFSCARKRYERQGVLITKASLQKARDDISAEIGSKPIKKIFRVKIND